MNGSSQDLREQLLRTNEEFNQLAAKHHELEGRLHELTSQPYLSEPERLEEVDLKKRKLQLKDRMEDILRRHRAEPGGPMGPGLPPHPQPHAGR
jgi:uncharacterized protein YdcH (DUF465 family)